MFQPLAVTIVLGLGFWALVTPAHTLRLPLVSAAPVVGLTRRLLLAAAIPTKMILALDQALDRADQHMATAAVIPYPRYQVPNGDPLQVGAGFPRRPSRCYIKLPCGRSIYAKRLMGNCVFWSSMALGLEGV